MRLQLQFAIVGVWDSSFSIKFCNSDGAIKPQQKQEEAAKPSVYLENQDNNGIVEKSDVVLTGNLKKSK